MKERKPYMVGSVRLSDLFGFEDTVKGGVRGCFIPYGPNPSLYLGQNRQTGGMTLSLDILVRETANSRTGSSHFIKLSVGKANRERLGISQETLDSLKIVGNLYTRTPEQPSGAALRPQGSGDWGQAPVGDMPDFTNSGRQAGW